MWTGHESFWVVLSIKSCWVEAWWLSQLDMHCSNLHSSPFSKPHAHLEHIWNIVQHWYWFWSSLSMCLKAGMVPHISCLRLNLDKFTFYKMYIIWSAFLSSSMWPWLSAHFIYPLCVCVCVHVWCMCVCMAVFLNLSTVDIWVICNCVSLCCEWRPVLCIVECLAASMSST